MAIYFNSFLVCSVHARKNCSHLQSILDSRSYKDHISYIGLANIWHFLKCHKSQIQQLRANNS